MDAVEDEEEEKDEEEDEDEDEEGHRREVKVWSVCLRMRVRAWRGVEMAIGPDRGGTVTPRGMRL